MADFISPDHENSDLSFVIVKATTFVLRSPIETPVQTSFGVMTDRPALYLLLEDDQGNIGVGEIWCNFPTCGAEHRQRLLETTILPALLGKERESPQQCYHTLKAQFKRLAIQSGEQGPIAQCIAGVDIALWDLVAKRLSLPLHKLLGSRSATIGCYASGLNPSDGVDTFLRCQDEGYTAFKLKIGFGDEIDDSNITGICAKLHVSEQLMVDANQAWTLDEALVQAKKLVAFPIAWLEEPMMADVHVEQWQTLAQASTIPLAAGENMADEQAFTDANHSSWLSVMQPDICKWGGFSGVLPIAKAALENGKRYCPHYLGGGVGLLASAHILAAAGGDGLLEVDANPNPLRQRLYSPVVDNGQTTLSDEPGLGVDPDQLTVLQNDPSLLGGQ